MHNFGILVVGHGTRNRAGQAEFLRVAEMLAARTELPLEACFLELIAPTIAEGCARLASRGVRRIVVVPLLLFSAGHAKDDVPQAVAAAAALLGMEVVGQTAALDAHPQLLALSRLRVLELGPQPPYEILFVGRGGGDPAALAAAHNYCQLLAESLHVPAQTAFVAIAQPSLKEMLAQVAARKPRKVVVVPHLLFQGEVLQEINDRVNELAQTSSTTPWRVASHLGPHEFLVEAIQHRIANII